MICAVLIPTRRRAERLAKCVESFFAHGTHGKFEVWIATDTDDAASTRKAIELEEKYTYVYHLEGHRRRGYEDLGVRYTELAELSQAKWIWMMNDDCEVGGRNWTEEIKQHSIGILHPEIYRLGGSTYKHDVTGAFPIVHNHVWKQFGADVLGHPSDKWLNEQCAANSFPIHFLSGVELSHQRIADEILPHSRL